MQILWSGRKTPVMSKIWWVLIAVMLGTACNPEQPRFAFKTAEKRGRLESNGLKFVLLPDASTELVEVDMHSPIYSSAISAKNSPSAYRPAPPNMRREVTGAKRASWSMT